MRRRRIAPSVGARSLSADDASEGPVASVRSGIEHLEQRPSLPAPGEPRPGGIRPARSARVVGTARLPQHLPGRLGPRFLIGFVYEPNPGETADDLLQVGDARNGHAGPARQRLHGWKPEPL